MTDNIYANDESSHFFIEKEILIPNYRLEIESLSFTNYNSQ